MLPRAGRTRRLVALGGFAAVLAVGALLVRADQPPEGRAPAPSAAGSQGPTTPGSASQEDPGAYSWKPVTVRGGGWVTGLVATPSGGVWARTDVGGAYHWDDAAQTWRQLLMRGGVQDPVPADYGVEALAVAPSDDRVVYLSVGRSLDEREGRVLRSTDGGRTWQRSGERFTVDGNADWRQAGARLAVDPADPDVAYLGTREEGLFRTTDGGRSWRPLSALPAAAHAGDGAAAGVTFVIPFGGTDGTPAGLWAGVEGVGVLRSDDAGRSWDLVHPTPGGIPRDAERGADGRLYVVVAGSSAGVVRISATGEAVPVSPGGAPAVVAVDPADPDHVFVGDGGIRDGFLWRSRDGGTTWDTLDVALASPDAPWPLKTDLESYMSSGELAFDPARPGTLWFAEGMGVWRSDDLDDGEVTWTFTSNGIEELVSNDAVKPAGFPLLTAHWDRNVFRHPADGPAEVPLTGRFDSAWSLAVAPKDPSFVVAVVDDHRFCCDEDGLAGQSGWSEDGGATWHRFGSLAGGTHPQGLAFGGVAVSSGSVDHLVWVPSNGGKVHYSRDRGQTWQPAAYPGSEPDFAYYLHRHVLTSDPVRPDTFYVLDADGVLGSTDGGATWQLKRGQGLPDRAARRFNATLAAVPGRAGELVMTTGLLDEGSHPLYHSTDGGDTWTELPGLADVGRVCLAPAARPGGVPLMFATGRQGSDEGLWRSADLGTTWEQISAAPGGNYQDITVLAADPDAYGTVYVGFSGTGFLSGTPR